MAVERYEQAERLRAARRSAGFTSAAEASDRFHWKYGTYSAHENGTRGIGRTVARYAAAFKVSSAWLLTGEGQGPSPEDAARAGEINRLAALVRTMRNPARRARVLQEAEDQAALDRLDQQRGSRRGEGDSE